MQLSVLILSLISRHVAGITRLNLPYSSLLIMFFTPLMPGSPPYSSAVFDAIDHGILLNCLENVFGISVIPLQWLSSYIAGRFQYVK